MSRINKAFQNKNLLTIFFTAGHPNLNDTEQIILELDSAGVDIIEIGMPNSDPLADGPTIQRSSEKALSNGMNLKLMFQQLKGIRNKTNIPLVLMGYCNQLLQYGIEDFCKKAAEVGIDGLILPDLPVEVFESNCKDVFRKYDLTCSFLVTPSTSEARIRLLDKASSGFLYAVSSHSITGGTSSGNLSEYGNRLKSMELKNPIQIGFGIRDNASFSNAVSVADGAIIGSAFIQKLEEQGELKHKIQSFVEEIKNTSSIEA